MTAARRAARAPPRTGPRPRAPARATAPHPRAASGRPSIAIAPTNRRRFTIVPAPRKISPVSAVCPMRSGTIVSSNNIHAEAQPGSLRPANTSPPINHHDPISSPSSSPRRPASATSCASSPSARSCWRSGVPPARPAAATRDRPAKPTGADAAAGRPPARDAPPVSPVRASSDSASARAGASTGAHSSLRTAARSTQRDRRSGGNTSIARRPPRSTSSSRRPSAPTRSSDGGLRRSRSSIPPRSLSIASASSPSVAAAPASQRSIAPSSRSASTAAPGAGSSRGSDVSRERAARAASASPARSIGQLASTSVTATLPRRHPKRTIFDRHPPPARVTPHLAMKLRLGPQQAR